MSVSIRTNVASLNAQRAMSQTQSMLDSSLAKLASGYRITQAGDDAAGLGISTNLSAQIRSYSQAIRNANDGQSLIQAAEAGLNNSANILTRMRELAMQSASDGVGAAERAYIQVENAALKDELQRVAVVTEYNGTYLLNGTTATLDFQVGVRGTTNDVISFVTMDATTSALGVTTVNLSTKAGAVSALAILDTAHRPRLVVPFHHRRRRQPLQRDHHHHPGLPRGALRRQQPHPRRRRRRGDLQPHQGPDPRPGRRLGPLPGEPDAAAGPEAPQLVPASPSGRPVAETPRGGFGA